MKIKNSLGENINMKTTATDVKEVLDKYIEENKKEFEDSEGNLKPIQMIRSMSDKLIDVCIIQDSFRNDVKSDKSMVVAALMRGFEFINENKE